MFTKPNSAIRALFFVFSCLAFSSSALARHLEEAFVDVNCNPPDNATVQFLLEGINFNRDYVVDYTVTLTPVGGGLPIDFSGSVSGLQPDRTRLVLVTDVFSTGALSGDYAVSGSASMYSPAAIFRETDLFNTTNDEDQTDPPVISCGGDPEPAALGNYVWLDDGDGLQDPDAGVGGVTVELYQCEDGEPVPGAPFASQTTSGSGGYLFNNLPAGEYKVTFIAPGGLDFTLQNAGSDDTLDSDADPATGMTDCLTLAPGETNLDLDAGLVEPPPEPAALGNYVWLDDGDGIQDPNAGVDGVTVELYQCEGGQPVPGAPFASQTTSGGGGYLFNNLPAGEYKVTFIAPGGLDFTLQNAGSDDTLDSDADPATGMTDCLTLAPGETNLDLDAGLVEPPPEPAALGNYVWLDDGDGIQDPNAGVDGVTVELYQCEGGQPVPGAPFASQTTSGGGGYLFNNLPAGEYKVTFIAPGGLDFTLQNAGSDDTLDSDADPATGMTDCLTLAPGETNLDLDAGLVEPPPEPAALGNYVWLDDGDGIQDPNAGVDGVTVELYQCEGGQPVPGAPFASQTTSGGGGYLFNNLPAGEYKVTFIAPDGFSFTLANAGPNDATDSDADAITGMTQCFTLNAGETDLSVDAGLLEPPPPASLGDFVWLDLNGNGIQDANEPGVDGVTVELYQCDNGVPLPGPFASQTTSGGGGYLFEDLAAGEYKVTFTALDGFSFTAQDAGDDLLDSDADPATGMTDCVTLDAGENDLSLDAGLIELASLGDFVWLDLNGDGIQDPGETGVGGATVELFECNAGVPGDLIATQTSSGGGGYLFDNLPAGDYKVTFTAPDGFIFTVEDAGTDDSADSDADQATGMTQCVTLDSGENDLSLDAGLINPASLGDFVWEDLNGDGIQDPGEPGVDDVTVDLFECTNGVPGAQIDSQITSDGGGYLFDNLPSGEYKVTFIAPAGFGFTTEGAGIDDAVDSDADPANGMTQCIMLDNGETDDSLDAGLIQPASLGDYVWEDLNQNGLQDIAEPGINGVIVTLTDCSGDPVTDLDGNPVNPTSTAVNAGEDGFYSFDNLNPGCYQVEFTAPPGYQFTNLGDGTSPEDDSNANPGNGTTDPIVLGSGEDDPTIDAGLFRNQGLGDFLFEDRNGNGIQDPDEPGIAGVQVNLLAGDNCETPTGDFTTTDTDGIYVFNGLEPGTYCVEFELPPICGLGVGDASFTSQNNGTDDLVDSDVNNVGVSDPATLGAGELNLSVDAGVFCPAKLGDLVWDDANSDGIQDNVPVDEGPLAGVTVNLLDCDGNPATDLDGLGSVVTGADGMYMFRVIPGSYIVEFVSPEGRSFSPAGAGGNTDLDSNANPVSGRSDCIDVPSDTFESSIDAGVTPPLECGLAVNKQCAVLAPEPSQPFTCDGSVDTLVMRYDGSLGDLLDVQAYAGDVNASPMPVNIDGDIVTVTGYQAANAPNDVVWVVDGSAGSGQSTFHLSCSDDEMDGETDNPAFPNDCGRPEGDGKDNSAGDNLWLLEGLETDSGDVLQCVPPVPDFADACEFQAQFASCESLPDNPDVITFRYTGGGCAASDNDQGDDATCQGAINGSQAVTLTDDAGNNYTLQPGELVDIQRGDASEMTLSNAGGTETLGLHTSCSQPIQTGDVYGSLTLVALDGVGGGSEVQFSYAVMNNGTAPISNILVSDTELGLIEDGLALNPGETTTLYATDFIDTTTTNTAEVFGEAEGVLVCEASDSVTVTVQPPPVCTVTAVYKDLSKSNIKYTLANTGNQTITLDNLVFNFPVPYHQVKEVKLDGTLYRWGVSPLRVTPGVPITATDWSEPDVTKRQLDPGEVRTLEIKFTRAQEESLYEDDIPGFFSGAAGFEEGCSVNF